MANYVNYRELSKLADEIFSKFVKTFSVVSKNRITQKSIRNKVF